MSLLVKDYAPQQTTCRSERAEIIKSFVDSINAEREANKWRYKAGDKWKKLYPVTGKGIAMKCSHIKDLGELRYFNSECRQARSYGEYFYGRLKVSNYKQI